VENATLYAPDLPRGFPWINTPRPLTLRELRGRLVLVHFWCSSSVECTQMLPMLRAFEERHRNDPVVVIGVHSARLDGEREIERVEDAVRRHDIRHPVLVDSDLQVWRAYGVEQWPTIAVVRPDSTLATVAPGEPSVEALERFLREELRRGRDKAQLTEVPLQYLAEPAPPCGPLSFPGGVAVSRHGRVAVSDTANHRVLVFDAAGDLALIAGSGDDGHVDGAVGEARLSEPKGLAFDGDGRVLFVADPGNHTVRRIDLDAGRVTTLAGTGALGEAALRPRQRYAGAATALRSPTGVALGDGSLFISLAGSHQVATVDARSGELALLAGTGEVSCVDGGIDAATFGQPTGLSLSGRSLFVADAENSAVRRVDLDLGAVDTIVGSGAFDFGYEDGPRSRALLQRCLDVAALPDGNTLLVADAYNGRLRLVSIETGDTTTLPTASGDLGLRDPGALCIHPTRGTALVVDTAHHRIIEVGLDGKSARVVELGPVPDVPRGLPAGAPPVWLAASLAHPISLRDGDTTIAVRVRAADGCALAADGITTGTAEVTRRGELLALRSERLTAASSAPLTLAVRVARTTAPTDAEILLSLELPLAPGGPRASLRALVRLPLRLGEGGGSEPRVDVPLRRSTYPSGNTQR
jgi:sugar lactone lactonase YvrE/thiol-disulfide isomerase/thioredoxin